MSPKAELIQYYRWLRQYGLNDSHSGNASVREGDKIWVTPTGACADSLQEQELIACNIDGTIGPGASLDAGVHVAVYQKNPKTNAVLHSHGPYTVALTLNGKDYSPPDFEGQFYFGARIPVLNIAYGDYQAETAPRVATMLADHPIVVVRGHGIYAQAESLNLAYKWICSLELSAKTAFIARQAGTLLD